MFSFQNLDLEVIYSFLLTLWVYNAQEDSSVIIHFIV